MIPKIIHFIFGLSEDFGEMPFSKFHYWSILSAKIINKDYEIVLHYFYEPINNEWWEKCRTIARLDRITYLSVSIAGRSMIKHAHRADILRLDILNNDGGIYLDIDTVCIKPMDPLLLHSDKVVMGIEIFKGGITGLCNAVIISNKNNEFLKKWKQLCLLEFDPDDYNKIAVRLPWKLYLSSPHEIWVEPPESFFRLTWSEADFKEMYFNKIIFDRSYLVHLYNGAWKYLQKISVEDIMSKDTSYNLLMRKILTEPHT